MLIKICDTPGVSGGRALLLCDDLGNQYPNQVEVTTNSTVADYPSITVTFLVDGKTVKFAD